MELYGHILEQKHWFGNAYPKWWPDFGPGTVAGFLSARVRPALEAVWFDPPRAMYIGELLLAYNAENL